MLRLLIDENFNHRILRGLIRRIPQLDFVVVAQIGLSGTEDLALLRWAARNDRIMVTHDLKTMIPCAEQLLALEEPMAGVILVADRMGIGTAIENLQLLIECQSQAEMHSRIEHLPL